MRSSFNHEQDSSEWMEFILFASASNMIASGKARLFRLGCAFRVIYARVENRDGWPNTDVKK